MQDDRFEWDDGKAASNRRKHGVSFEYARLVFEDPAAIDTEDNRQDYGEERYNIIGQTADGIYLFVAYTERAERIRLISARRALRHEIARYLAEKF